LGPHALSLVEALLPPITQISATRGIRDTINVSLEHEGGAGSLLTLTVTAPEVAEEYSITSGDRPAGTTSTCRRAPSGRPTPELSTS
jgi:hypothetical protein